MMPSMQVSEKEALQIENDELYQRIEQLQAQVDRVSKLPAAWCCAEWRGHDNNQIAKECADELQAAIISRPRCLTWRG